MKKRRLGVGNDFLSILSQSLCTGGGLYTNIAKYWSSSTALVLTNSTEAASDGSNILSRS